MVATLVTRRRYNKWELSTHAGIFAGNWSLRYSEVGISFRSNINWWTVYREVEPKMCQKGEKKDDGPLPWYMGSGLVPPPAGAAAAPTTSVRRIIGRLKTEMRRMVVVTTGMIEACKRATISSCRKAKKKILGRFFLGYREWKDDGSPGRKEASERALCTPQARDGCALH